MRPFSVIRPLVVLLTCLLMLSACALVATKTSPEELAAAQSAAMLARQGQLDQAARAYLVLADRYGGNADHYRVLAADAWSESGHIDTAAPVLARIRRNNLTGSDPVRLDLLRANLALHHHDAATALRLTTQPTVAVPDDLQLRLYELRARALTATGDRWGAARTRAEMDSRLHGLDRAQNRRAIVHELTALGVGPLKQRAAAMQPGDRMLPWINQALQQLGVAVAQPQPTLNQPVGTLLPGTGADVREGYRMPAHVALLLPESGAFADASEAIREGFFAAYAEAARNHAPRASVRIYDTLGTTSGAVGAYQQATKDGAQLVVGPLTRNAVAAVFALPQLPVPVLALNHPDDKQLPASEASEFGLLPETEGAQAADHMAERNLLQAYVIVSSDDFAQRAAAAFKAEMAARGGNVAGMATLPTGSVNYTSTIAQLGANGAGDGAGIFISMRPAQARLLVPQLLTAKITLPVFATSHVYAGNDNPTADNDLNGVEFPDAPWLFDAQPGLPKHADVANLLPAARDAGARLFAFGMDAWNLVPYLHWLRDHPGSYLPGATGQLTADEFGQIRRVMTWARFDNGVARPLSDSLQVDNAPAPAGTSPTPATPAPAGSAAAPAGAG
ncbi:MAG: penicillin-binding protein activator [Rhodanobacter sp.]|nr:MAG: penicillin-binding protein activator [Rhodanobacter sp.]TAM15041.1 MAG: penicillin-binding protein activator [Rhodanobacter sp.]TAM36489.1 MAG: penicillin-binding protein activator [Rhodanobacter sp.]